MQKTLKTLLMSTLLISSAYCTAASAQSATPSAKNAVATPDNALMLTVFLKHDQSRPLGEQKAQLAQLGFYKTFPPEGVEIVSWHTVMGIGQIATVRFPASRLLEVNLALERTAWGSFRTEFYPTYNVLPLVLEQQIEAKKTQTGQ